MPRAILTHVAHADRSRTVSSVADELGVSASTLRTWERRYGLGPARREAGSRRRYQPEDVERLRAMVNHLHAGLPAAEAAKRALSDVTAHPNAGHVTASQLRSIVLSDDISRLEDALEATVASHGLVHTWSRFVEPTLKTLRTTPGGDPVGAPPALMLLNAFQRVCRSVHLSRPARSFVGGDRVALITDALHETPAQVIGVALAWYGCDVRVLSSEHYGGVCADDRFREYVRAGVPAIAIVLGCGPACADTIEGLISRYGGPTIIVGTDAPDILAPHVQRVRTINACVEEALALLAPQADLQLVGRS